MKKVRIGSLEPYIDVLAQFLGELNKPMLIENAHRLREEERTELGDWFRIFNDSSFQFDTIGTKLIVLGIGITPHMVTEARPEVLSRLAYIECTRMSDDEIEKICRSGMSLLKVQVSDEIVSGLVGMCAGFQGVAHGLCKSLCEVLGVVKTARTRVKPTGEDWVEAVRRYCDLRSGTWVEHMKTLWRIGNDVNNFSPRDILDQLEGQSIEGMTVDEMLHALNRSGISITSSRLEQMMSFIEKKTQFIHVDDKGKVAFSEPLLGEYYKLYERGQARNVNGLAQRRLPTELVERLFRPRRDRSACPRQYVVTMCQKNGSVELVVWLSGS